MHIFVFVNNMSVCMYFLLCAAEEDDFDPSDFVKARVSLGFGSF